MFRNISLLFMAALLMQSITSHAQHVDAPWGLGVGFNAREFSQIPNNEFENLEWYRAFRIQWGRYLNPSFDAILASTFFASALQDRRKEELLDLDLNLRYKLNNGYMLKERSVIAPYLSAGFGINLQEEVGDQLHYAVPLGVGTRLNFGPHISLDLNVKYHLDVSDNFQDYAALNAGLIINFGQGKEQIVSSSEPTIPPPDSDRDGVLDRDDRCPFLAGPVNLNGCPDSDNDGLIDLDDLCPDEPGTKEDQGCPVRDRDGDGVSDGDDRCPDVKGLPSLFGCPDQDGDGIADIDDKCPEINGVALFDGCPDSDGDGIADANDRCPEEAGTPEMKGCPEPSVEILQTLEMVKKAVKFRTGSSQLTQSSFTILDTVASIMKEFPWYYMKVSGHTDNTGSEQRNLQLSKDRAASCADYLISKGIAEGRVAYQGYGSARPVSDNGTPSGRATNRRVEFVLFME